MTGCLLRAAGLKESSGETSRRAGDADGHDVEAVVLLVAD